MLKFIFSLSLISFLPVLSSAQRIVGKGRAVDPYNYSIRKNETFGKGAVASAHPIASRVGAAILKQGGNAIDAVIAMQLTLAVVYPGAGNIGGGGFMVARLKDGTNLSLDYRETAP